MLLNNNTHKCVCCMVHCCVDWIWFGTGAPKHMFTPTRHTYRMFGYCRQVTTDYPNTVNGCGPLFMSKVTMWSIPLYAVSPQWSQQPWVSVSTRHHHTQKPLVVCLASSYCRRYAAYQHATRNIARREGNQPVSTSVNRTPQPHAPWTNLRS